MEGLLESETEPCGFSAEFAFFAVLVSSTTGLPLRWVFFAFASTTGALLRWVPAALGRRLMEVVSARLNPSHGTIMLGKCMLLDFCLVTTNVWRERR